MNLQKHWTIDKLERRRGCEWWRLSVARWLKNCRKKLQDWNMTDDVACGNSRTGQWKIGIWRTGKCPTRIWQTGKRKTANISCSPYSYRSLTPPYQL